MKPATDLQRIFQSIHNASSISHGGLVLEISKHQPSANLKLTVRERKPSYKETTAAASSDLFPVPSIHVEVKMVIHYPWPEALHRDQKEVSIFLGTLMHGILPEIHTDISIIKKK